MTLSRQTLKRLPTIKAGLLKGLNYTQIGEKAGVYEKTIDRDIKAWVDSGQFETWLKEEWVRLHNIIIHNDPTEAYRQLSKIMGRMVTRKAEIKKEIKTEHRTDVHVLLEKYETTIAKSAERNLQQDSS